MGQFAVAEQDIPRTFALLGGEKTIKQPVRNSLDAHDLLMKGLPASALLHLVTQAAFVTTSNVLDKAIGISARTLQRRKKDLAETNLSIEQSSRTWKFAEVLGRATEIFGSKEAAERWMTSPALGLNQRKPIDLFATAVGLEAVEDYLTRIEYGVYV